MSLPDDIVREIFSYLPAKSACRFRCVSRAWHATLSSASFIHLHLRRANKRGEPKVFFSRPNDTLEEEPYNDDAVEEESDPAEEESKEEGTSLKESYEDDGKPEEASYEDEESCDEDDAPEETSSSVDDTLEEESCFYAWQPGGAVKKLSPNNFLLATPLSRPLHGLVLIRSGGTGYHVYNPSTGAALAIPDSTLPAKMIWRRTSRDVKLPHYFYVAYGLGYCSVSGEYKAVRLFSNNEDYGEYSQILCEVFVLDTLAYWRPAAQQPPACVVQEKNTGVFLNGSLHFLCKDGGILAFHVSGETFGSVLPPPNLDDSPTKITELDGCLCICHGDIGYGNRPCHVWVLRNYKQGKWELLCRVDPTAWTELKLMQLDSDWIAPLYMYNDRGQGHEKIMFDTGTCKVFALDVLNGNTPLPEVIFNPEEAIGGRFQDYDAPGLGLFEESLVPVGRTIEEMVLSSPNTKAWFDILKWMPTRYVASLSLVCRAWRAMVKDDHFIRSHVAHANLNKSPRIMMIQDPTFGVYVDLQDVINGTKGYTVSARFVCSQPCHGLNAGTDLVCSFVCNPVRGYIERIFLDGVDEDTVFAGQTGTGGKRGFHSTRLSRTKFDPRPKGLSVPVHLKMWAREH
jgi:F-box interacting protein